MIQKPTLKNTVVSNDNYEWRPADFKSFLVERDHIQGIINGACLFRGHRKTDRLLDSTFARNLKLRMGIPITHRYPEQALCDIEMQHAFAKLWLQKIDSIQLNPEIVKMESQGVDPYFEYHRHHQQNPNDKHINDVGLKGTNFIDFSYDWKVALFFANDKRENADEGALFNVFQRSSSCVEGRNGQLSLKFHAFRRINEQTLGVLTILHNFFIKRADGTTAAERFFEHKHSDLFRWLLGNVELPRPRKKHERMQREPIQDKLVA